MGCAHFFYWVLQMEKLADATWKLLVDETERILRGEGMELWDIEFKPEKGGQVLRIYIDKPEGVNVDDCANISIQVGMMLDVENIIPHRYTLEVSSPGLDRKLVKPEHFQRYSGSMVRIRLKPEITGRKKFSGRLEGLQENTAVIQDQNEGQTHRIPLDSIMTARLEIEL